MLRKIYQCRVCGSLVEVLSQGAGGFSCCGAPLTFFGESRSEAYREKQAPLDLVEVRAKGKSCWQFLQPGEAPPASAS
jgi:desulfoferrodoxin-like iron-binding protein